MLLKQDWKQIYAATVLEHIKTSEKLDLLAVKAQCYAKLQEVNHSQDPMANIKPSAEQVNKY